MAAIPEINTADMPAMKRLMDRHDEFPLPLSGKDDRGEDVLVAINEDNITLMGRADNPRYMRELVYWRDGTTEELYEPACDRPRWDSEQLSEGTVVSE